MKNIVLTGFMGTGKTEVSKILSKRLKRRRLCIDDMIEQKTGKTIPEIFKDDKEPVFREIESEAIKAASAQTGVVIDAGGGAIINEINFKNLKKHGVIFCLTASIDAICERTKNYSHRPLLNTEDPKRVIEELLTQRAKFYKRADHTIDTTELTPNEVADKIIEIMKKYEPRY